MSTDATVAVALAAGAHVHRHPFQGYAAQRNAALTDCGFKHGWVLVLDADERLPAAAVEPLMHCVRNARPEVGAFRLRRRDHFEGRWLRHAQMSPYYVRLLRKGRVSYHREVNEVARVEGTVSDAGVDFDHHPFSKGIGRWMQRHLRYAAMEADRLVEERSGRLRFSWARALLSSDFHERRYHQKGLYYRMPCRPLLKWIYLVIVRRAFMDGMPGLRYAWLQTVYESLIDMHVRERRAEHRDRPTA